MSNLNEINLRYIGALSLRSVMKDATLKASSYTRGLWLPDTNVIS